MSGIPTHGSPAIAQPSVDRFAALAFADSRERVFELAQAADDQRSVQRRSPGSSPIDPPQIGLRCRRGNHISRVITWFRSLFGIANNEQRAATRIYASEIVRAYGQAGERWVQQAGIALNRPLTSRQVARVEATRLTFLRQSRVLHALIPDHQCKVTPEFQALLRTLHAQISESGTEQAGDELIQSAAANRQSLFGPGALPGSLSELADLRNAWSDLSAWPEAEREHFLTELRTTLKKTIIDFAIAMPVADDMVMRATHERLRSTGADIRPEPSDFALNEQWIERVKASFTEEIRNALASHLQRVELEAAKCISGLQTTFPLIPTGQLHASEAFSGWITALEEDEIRDQLIELREQGTFLEPHLSGENLHRVSLDERTHPTLEVQLERMLEACSVMHWPEDQQQALLHQFRHRAVEILHDYGKRLPISSTDKESAMADWQAEIRQSLERTMRQLIRESFQSRSEALI